MALKCDDGLDMRMGWKRQGITRWFDWGIDMRYVCLKDGEERKRERGDTCGPKWMELTKYYI